MWDPIYPKPPVTRTFYLIILWLFLRDKTETIVSLCLRSCFSPIVEKLGLETTTREFLLLFFVLGWRGFGSLYRGTKWMAHTLSLGDGLGDVNVMFYVAMFRLYRWMPLWGCWWNEILLGRQGSMQICRLRRTRLWLISLAVCGGLFFSFWLGDDSEVRTLRGSEVESRWYTVQVLDKKERCMFGVGWYDAYGVVTIYYTHIYILLYLL